ncbi:hypothetical protein CSHISOI_01652 [Colletotrichum shisoi]|uniref:Uncharacterized protein n=1 Tax=Colletotrichum shisoi TaxID=2078593 RepID=A0A5Q4C360_9PEZI|nr:hypothetical protein CSHISOI_01652 [Colletotrichum shisoi]
MRFSNVILILLGLGTTGLAGGPRSNLQLVNPDNPMSMKGTDTCNVPGMEFGEDVAALHVSKTANVIGSTSSSDSDEKCGMKDSDFQEITRAITAHSDTLQRYEQEHSVRMEQLQLKVQLMLDATDSCGIKETLGNVESLAIKIEHLALDNSHLNHEKKDAHMPSSHRESKRHADTDDNPDSDRLRDADARPTEDFLESSVLRRDNKTKVLDGNLTRTAINILDRLVQIQENPSNSWDANKILIVLFSGLSFLVSLLALTLTYLKHWIKTLRCFKWLMKWLEVPMSEEKATKAALKL